MQEAAAARTKTSLTYWLTACHGKTCALSNNTPIKVYFCCTWNLSGLKSKQRDFIFRSVCTNFALRCSWVKPSTFLLYTLFKMCHLCLLCTTPYKTRQWASFSGCEQTCCAIFFAVFGSYCWVHITLHYSEKHTKSLTIWGLGKYTNKS